MDDVNAVLMITQDREHLAAAGQVERELVRALLRLSRDPWKDPRGTGNELTPKGKPSWWWRVRLVEWAGSAQAAARCNREALRGFRLYLRDLSDQELCEFIGRALEPQGGLEESA